MEEKGWGPVEEQSFGGIGGDVLARSLCSRMRRCVSSQLQGTNFGGEGGVV